MALEGHGGGFDVRLANGDLLRPEAVVLASPGPATAGLLDKIAPAAAAHVRSIAHGSTAVVSLGSQRYCKPGCFACSLFFISSISSHVTPYGNPPEV